MYEPSFAQRLIAWQQLYGRHELPWQGRDAYRIWLSEIMLQQTRVTTVLPYFARFLARFPSLSALAGAPLEAVLECWAGLGYYARARNLHRCAQMLEERFGGCFPDDPVILAELPGIGRSTAAAITAFAYGRRAAILDGNVRRVFCRHFGVQGDPSVPEVQRRLWALAEELLPAAAIETYTQGLMDLGSLCCTRARPRCGECPLATSCVAQAQGLQEQLPSPRQRREVPERVAEFLLVSDGRSVLLERRPPSGLWGGLLVPPEGDPQQGLRRLGLVAGELRALPEFSHRFTHFLMRLRPFVYDCVALPVHCGEDALVALPIADLGTAALPTPIRRLLALLSRADRAG
jgi:A/G-specific adenine glycosylase